MNQNDAERDPLVADMKTVIADAEELLRATASAAGEKVSAARLKSEVSLRAAKLNLADVEEAVIDRSKAAIAATDDYVHAYPWRAIGCGAAIGLLVGVLIGRR